MPISTRRFATAVADSRAARALIANEVREARLNAGLSQQEAARSVGMSHAQLGRIERTMLAGLSVEQASRACRAVGLRLVVRAYPVGDGPRDQGQLNLLARLRAVLPDGVRTSTEVPIGPLDDLRAWDMVIRCIDGDVAVEAETRLRDMQALERRLALKQRDGGIDRLVLVMGDTAHNRAVLRAAREGLRAGFPLDTRMALAALRAGHRPRANAIIVV